MCVEDVVVNACCWESRASVWYVLVVPRLEGRSSRSSCSMLKCAGAGDAFCVRSVCLNGSISQELVPLDLLRVGESVLLELALAGLADDLLREVPGT